MDRDARLHWKEGQQILQNKPGSSPLRRKAGSETLFFSVQVCLRSFANLTENVRKHQQTRGK